MAEQTFKSPGFFEREIEIVSRPFTRRTATPVGVIGPSQKGQAFVPKTVTSADEFIREFGMPDQDTSAAHAISEFFANNGKAATFCRILGTGKGSGASYAGFKLDGTALALDDGGSAKGAVQFIVANHTIADAEHVTYGIYNDNDSHDITGADTDFTDADGGGDSDVDNVDANADTVQLVRAMLFLHKDCSLRIANAASDSTDDGATKDH